MGGRRAPSFYFFTPGYRHFQSNQQHSKSLWGTLNQTGSAHDIISSKDQNQASFLTSWVLDGNQQPRRRDKRKCKWFTVLQISVEIQIKQSTMTLWWQAHFLYLPNRRHRWTTLHFLIRLNNRSPEIVTTYKTYHKAQTSLPSEKFYNLLEQINPQMLDDLVGFIYCYGLFVHSNTLRPSLSI